TGAGRGIGREIALLCAAEGAKVVVNDPGGAADGSGTNAAPAEEVVEEIRKRGGTAVANFETVAEAIPASRIVKTATDHFGKLDGLVLCRTCGGAAVSRAGKRLLRPFHLDLRPRRKFRPGQLCRGETRHRRA